MSKKKETEEFKPNVIEPIEGQMCYDELLVPEMEEKKEEKDTSTAKGQLDIWGMSKQSTSLEDVSKKTRKTKIKTEDQVQTENLEVESNELTDLAEDAQSEGSGAGNGGTSNGGSAGGSGILFKPLEEVLHDSMIPYTESVVMDRALPRVEDGLKPVQRRILYSMLELGLTPDKPYRKSARIVGDCMGKYHPHGDSSVYDAMVRMSQDFVLRAPLIDGHGNFGSIDGDSAAAMRYTEARMTPLSMELLRDLEKDTVRWGLNFDDTLKEPEVLPGRFPNLLVNGTSGIAVGVATNIPPHNLGEVIDGVVAYIDNPDITLDKMMKIVKGPDFPTGGELIFGDGLKSAYETGKGKIVVRAKVGIEQQGDKQSLVISELPYQVNKALLLQKIAELKEKNKDKLSVISEIRDESDRNGMRAVIRLKKEANAKKILGYLFQSTNLQISYGINMVAIAGGKPRLLGLLDIISYYTAFQRDVVVRRTKFDLNVARDRAHIVEGLLVAIKNIDAVIKIIKTSANVSEAKQRLRDKFKLSEKQAQAILDMRLARLVNLEVNKLEEELANLKIRIKELEAILNSKKLQLEVVKKEILEIKKKFNTPRRSKEIKSDEIVLAKIEDMEDTKDYLVTLSAGKTLKKVSVKNYSKSQKTITDNSTLFDIHTTMMEVHSSDTILIFTDKGNCVKANVASLPEAKWREKGIPLKQLDKTIDIMETPVAIVKAENEGEIVFFTQNGMVKRSTMKDMIVAKTYYQAIKLSEGDKLINAEKEVKGKTFIMFSKNGNVVNFEKSEVAIQGRVSGGVKGINLDDKETVVFAGQNMCESYMIITNNGYVKNLNALQIPISARYRKGVKFVNFEKTGKTVYFVGKGEKCVVDHGLKFEILETTKIKQTNDRLSSGQEIIKKRFLGVYNLVD
ncbi:MAG: DNA topoisomerase 4 subunit A [Clostridia bacterium]|nr:DNA topoisomerase 4 subunit A [Clostridia bacterium]